MAPMARLRDARRLVAGLALALTALGTVTARGDGQHSVRRQQPLVIDHRSLADFDGLSALEIKAAAGLRFLLRSASIGWNMDQGLSCLMNHFPDRPRRPNFCDRGIPRGQVVYDARYDRRNWRIELRGNPGWYGKVTDFIGRVNSLKPGERFDVVGFNFNYSDGVEGSAIVDQFFSTAPNAKPVTAGALEALEKRHPEAVFVWWSMALPRRSSPTMQAFNRRIRAYALERGKVLFDLADIESHRADGSPCTDNQGQGLEALCEEYTDERDSGHLNARGSQRAAMALWILMTRLAGKVG